MAVRCEIQQLRLLERGLAVGHDPAGVEADVAVRGPAHVDVAVEEEEGCSLGVLGGIEDYVAILGVVACAGIGCGDLGWAAGYFRAGGDVERVQALVVCTG